MKQSAASVDNQSRLNNMIIDYAVNPDADSDGSKEEADLQSCNDSYDDETCSCHGIENSATDDSDAESDITILSWESDEEFLRTEGAPAVFNVADEDTDVEAEMSDIEMEISDEEFDVIDDLEGTTDPENSPEILLQTYQTLSEHGRKEEDAIDSTEETVISMDLTTGSLIFSTETVQDAPQEVNEEGEKEGYQSMDSSVLLGI